MKVYTRKGDDGTTGLLYGGRVPKASERPTAYGDVDEAQACIGLARAEVAAWPEARIGDLEEVLVELAHDLWVLMAELATAMENQEKLVDGRSRVTADMVTRLEVLIDDVSERFVAPTEFVTPGQTRLSAALDLARTVTRRAERSASVVAGPADSHVVPYLNRLSDLLWTLARWQEGEHMITKETPST